MVHRIRLFLFYISFLEIALLINFNIINVKKNISKYFSLYSFRPHISINIQSDVLYLHN